MGQALKVLEVQEVPYEERLAIAQSYGFESVEAFNQYMDALEEDHDEREG